MNYNKIEERLKEKVKELKGEERRLDVFKHLTVEQAEELLESVGIHIEYCIEALHYADNGIHHYEFFTVTLFRIYFICRWRYIWPYW